MLVSSASWFDVIIFLSVVAEIGFCEPTGGNQRDLARAKNAKKSGKKAAAEQESNKGLTLEQRKQR